MQARYEAVIFQKPEWMMFKVSEMLRVNGVRTMAIQCDPFHGDYERYFDRVVVTSHALRAVLGLACAEVIDDMLEVPSGLHKCDYAQTGAPLRLVWVGQGKAAHTSDFVARIMNHPRLSGSIEVVTIGQGDWATFQWSMATVYQHILDCDVAIIPMPEAEWASTKSTNRLTQFMALGMPTIASPIDSYRRSFAAGAPVLLASNLDEFVEHVENLRSPTVRETLGKAARKFAWQHYAPDTLGPLWLSEVERVLRSPGAIHGINVHTRLAGRLLRLFRHSSMDGAGGAWDVKNG